MRTRTLRLFIILTLLTTLFISLPGTAAASHQGEVGPSAVYFPVTGHVLADDFLEYWRHNGGLEMFGYPLTDVKTDPVTQLPTQYFERAIFEFHAGNPDNWKVLLRRLGADSIAGRLAETPFKPIPNWTAPNCDYYVETSHRVCAGFKSYWEKYGGLPVFGFPLSEEFTERNPDTGKMHTVQYFERARFEFHPEHAGTRYDVQLGRLGAADAQRNNIDIAPVAKPDDVSNYDTSLWYIPGPRPPAGAPTWASHWIEVNLSTQYMRAWEYETYLNGTYVSTGRYGYPTPTGLFTIYSKLRYDDMTSGPVATPSEYYYVPDVPHVMYFLAGGYAIHGAYWHNNFGSPFSAGCVSAPLGQAAWFYNWAPYGTYVWIHW